MRLKIENLSVSLERQDILQNISLQAEQGEFLSLLGPSGCGKTTLLKTIAGILSPHTGSIFLGGEDITRLPPHKRGVVILFQDIRLFPNMTVAENVAFPLKMQAVPKAARLAQAEDLLNRVQLPGCGGRRVGALSGGEQQRVALARALAAKPRLLLLDEPFSALDENLRDEMRALVLSLHRAFAMTTVLVTHDRGEALSMSDRVALLFAGAIEQLGTPEEVYLRPATRRAADYFGGCTYLDGQVRGGVFTGGFLTLPAALADGGYTLCLREDAWWLSPEGAYAFTVKSTQFCGAHTLAALSAPEGATVQKKLFGAVDVQPGAVLRFDLDPDAAVFFPREDPL